MNMPEQKYNPNQWVKYKSGSSLQISKIVGATLYTQEQGWIYIIVVPTDQNKVFLVEEKDIIEVLKLNT